MNVTRKFATSLFLLMFLSINTDVGATEPTPTHQLSDSGFTKIYVKPIPAAIIPSILVYERDKPDVISRPKVHLPSDKVIVVSIAPKQPKPKLKGKFTSGVASYYCLAGKSRCTVGHSGGMYAAIRSDLLFLRGKTVKVCKYKTTRCIFVTIIDCNCGENANLIDLYSDAFRKLTKLSMGVVKVTVKW